MRIGLLYDLFDHYPWREGEPFDADAENEPAETVEALEAAVRVLGHEPVRIGPARRLAERLFDGGRSEGDPGFDIAVNIAEGAHHRNREGEVPTFLDMTGIPYLGSDASTLSLSLDKAWTKDLAAAAGVRTPPYWIARADGSYVKGAVFVRGGVRAPNMAPRPIGCAEDANAIPGPCPLFLKPRYEGSAKGITAGSLVQSESELRPVMQQMIREYGQDVLIEPFIDGGGEFTVAIMGHRPARALPVIQRAVDRDTGIGIHVLERRGLPEQDLDWHLPGDLTPELERALVADALAVFHKLECRDFARVDFRVDAAGVPWFLEINPLPTFAPDGTFAIMAELMGQTYADFLADVLGEAIDRVRASSEMTDAGTGNGRGRGTAKVGAGR